MAPSSMRRPSPSSSVAPTIARVFCFGGCSSTACSAPRVFLCPSGATSSTGVFGSSALPGVAHAATARSNNARFIGAADSTNDFAGAMRYGRCMRRAALILCSLGCYPSSNFALPPAEGYLSRIILGAEPPFAHASPTEARSLPFTAGDDLILEALLYRETLAELGLAEGPIALEDGGRSPPAADAIWRTTIASGEFSGWDTVDGSELAERLRIPHFDANSCDGCIA